MFNVHSSYHRATAPLAMCADIYQGLVLAVPDDSASDFRALGLVSVEMTMEGGGDLLPFRLICNH